MFSIQVSLFFVLLAASIFHLLPQKKWQLRLFVVSFISFILVYALHPMAAFVAVFCAILAWGIHRMGLTRPKVQRLAPFSLLIILAIFSVGNFSVARDFYTQTFLNFGMSFYILRLYGTLRVAKKQKTEVSFMEFIAITIFFPIFSAGPIAYHDSFRTAMDRPFYFADWGYGLFRIGAGAFCLYFATGYLEDVIKAVKVGGGDNIAWQRMNAWTSYKVTMLKFAHLYMNFTGYTEIAIGLGHFFGFKMPENFRYPILSRNIQDFWKRWHLSLSSFITNHIYLPLVIKTEFKRPRASIFAAFVIIGLWHEISWQYFIWGIGHGAALVIYQTFSKTKRWKTRPDWLKNLTWPFGILVTLSYVGFLSVFANEPSLQKSLEFARSIFGLGGV